MSLTSLFKDALSSQRNESTSIPSATIPTQLLETFIPGYGPIHGFILDTFCIDITILVTFIAATLGLAKLARYVYHTIYQLVLDNFTATIQIDGYDDIWDHLMKWLAAQHHTGRSRYLAAETYRKTAWEQDEEYEAYASERAKGGDAEFWNFSNQEAKVPPRFIPAFGTYSFWHNGNYFMFRRSRTCGTEVGSTMILDKEDVGLTCLGRSPEPIKKLLQEAKDFYLKDRNAKTIIRRPSPKELRRWGSRSCWTQIAQRPSRPMDTVVLDAKRKVEVLADINEYLNPTTPRWYANRGIPYRRGYLFYGAPGTGKTSLSFAIAGVFGLDIYVISLLEPTLTEEDLGQLFNALPRRCVVLLEDIDSAGLNRPDEEKEKSELDSNNDDSTESESRGINLADLTRALKSVNSKSEEDKKKGISLSGLLNAIDGVASHEGRVLIMTTNKPEKLDDALIRPGRVDLKVAFGNATQPQIKELFERMYIDDPPRSVETKGALNSPLALATKLALKKPTHSRLLTPPPSSPSSPTTTTPTLSPSSEKDTPSLIATATTTTNMSHIIPADCGLPARALADIASDFASKIPDGEFSPAEVQGFLLKRKKSPQRALAEVEKWAKGMMEIKASKSKVLDVQ
jgi:mitochondrial chaperone BCS1